jgi:hypothetical protein
MSSVRFADGQEEATPSEEQDMITLADQIFAFCGTEMPPEAKASEKPGTAKTASSGPMPFVLATAEEIKARYGLDHFRDYLLNHDKKDYVLPSGIEPPAAKPDAEATKFSLHEGIAALCGLPAAIADFKAENEPVASQEPAEREEPARPLVIPDGFVASEPEQGPLTRMIDPSQWRR